jgi:glycosyltransferase involved in cell wall biosynthesis
MSIHKKTLLVVGHSLNEERQKALFRNKEFSDWNVHLAVPEIWNSNENKSCREEKIHITSLKTLFSGNFTRYFLVGLNNLINKINPDLIYLQAEPWSVMAIYCAILSRKTKIPLVLYSYENLKKVYERRNKKYLGLWKPLEKFVLRNSKGIIAGNLDAKKIILENGFKKRIEILPISGIGNNFYKYTLKRIKELKKTYGLENKKVVLFLGRLTAEKGVEEILDSVETVSNEVPEVLFLFVGSGDYSEKAKSFVKKRKIGQYVKFIENIDYEKVPHIMNIANLFVYPSRKTPYWEEQFGFSIPEALSCKVPVISTNTGAIPEFFGKYIKVLNEQDSKNLARSTIKILKKGSAQEIYKGEYSLENVARKTAKFFKQICSD